MKKFGILVLVGLLAACSKEQVKNDNQSSGEKYQCANTQSLAHLQGEDDYLCLIPQTKRQALVMYFMSNDCPGCGSWGTDMFHDLLEENAGNVNPMQVHIKYSDPWIIKGFSDSMVKRFNPQYTPFNMVENHPVTGRFQVNWNFADAKQKATDEITRIQQEGNEVSPAINFKLSGDKVDIHYGARFEQAVEGEYRMGLYLVEDSLEWNQAGSTKRPYYHDNTIRTAVDGAFGPSLLNGAAEQGKIVLGKTSIDKIGWWKDEDLYLLGVVWKRDDKGLMQVVNSVVYRP